MFERFVKDARLIVVDAQQEARALDAPAIGVEHILLATMRRCPHAFVAPGPNRYLTLHRADTVYADRLRELLRRETADALGAVGVSLREIEQRAAATFGDEEWEAVTRAQRLPFRNDAKRGLESALRVALDTRTRKITPAHILLGLLRSSERVRDLLWQLDVDPEELARTGESELVRFRDMVGR